MLGPLRATVPGYKPKQPRQRTPSERGRGSGSGLASFLPPQHSSSLPSTSSQHVNINDGVSQENKTIATLASHLNLTNAASGSGGGSGVRTGLASITTSPPMATMSMGNEWRRDGSSGGARGSPGSGGGRSMTNMTHMNNNNGVGGLYRGNDMMMPQQAMSSSNMSGSSPVLSSMNHPSSQPPPLQLQQQQQHQVQHGGHLHQQHHHQTPLHHHHQQSSGSYQGVVGGGSSSLPPANRYQPAPSATSSAYHSYAPYGPASHMTGNIHGKIVMCLPLCVLTTCSQVEVALNTWYDMGCFG
jgi:hypothetical protein